MAARIVSYFLTVPPGGRGQSEETRRWQKSIESAKVTSLSALTSKPALTANGEPVDLQGPGQGRSTAGGGIHGGRWTRFPAGGQGAHTGRSRSLKQPPQSLAGGTQGGGGGHWRRQSALRPPDCTFEKGEFYGMWVITPSLKRLYEGLPCWSRGMSSPSNAGGAGLILD